MKMLGVLCMAAMLGNADVNSHPFERRCDDGVFYIHTAEQLAEIQGMASLYMETGGVLGCMEFLTCADMRYALGADIELPSDVSWTPIGNSDENPRFVFRGSFDGAGYTIRGLEIDAEQGITQGLFGRTENAEIRNVIVKSASLRVRGDYGQRELAVGVLVGEATGGVFENIIISDAFVSAAAPDNRIGSVGGMVGKAADARISDVRLTDVHLDCTGDSQQLRAVGGIVGHLSNCAVEAAFFSAVQINSTAFNVGGIVGQVTGSTFSSSGVDMAYIIGSDSAGGFVGHINDSGNFISCHASAYVHGVMAGGFAGKSQGENDGGTRHSVEFTNCRASGAVYSWGGWAGGFAGAVAYSFVENCAAYSSVGLAADSKGAGGFVGRLVGRSIISDSYAKGDVDNSSQGSLDARCTNGYTGGFVGEIANSSRIESSYSAGMVAGGTATGGFAGVISAVGAPNTISDSVTVSPLVSGTGDVRRFAGRLDHDGVNGCFSYLGTVVIADGKLAHVIPSAYGADGGDVLK